MNGNSESRVIDDHRKTPYFATRFGGGLPPRPAVPSPPTCPASEESRYIQQLFEAYSEHKKTFISSESCLSTWNDLAKHYRRQREFFYHAESLRNFARDTVPPGTFEELQDEIYYGVVGIEERSFNDALQRVNEVLFASTQISLTANGLISAVKSQDRQGICHQLANNDRLHWKK